MKKEKKNKNELFKCIPVWVPPSIYKSLKKRGGSVSARIRSMIEEHMNNKKRG